MRRVLLAIAAFVFCISSASAQSTSGNCSPIVTESEYVRLTLTCNEELRRFRDPSERRLDLRSMRIVGRIGEKQGFLELLGYPRNVKKLRSSRYLKEIVQLEFAFSNGSLYFAFDADTEERITWSFRIESESPRTMSDLSLADIYRALTGDDWVPVDLTHIADGRRPLMFGESTAKHVGYVAGGFECNFRIYGDHWYRHMPPMIQFEECSLNEHNGNVGIWYGTKCFDCGWATTMFFSEFKITDLDLYDIVFCTSRDKLWCRLRDGSAKEFGRSHQNYNKFGKYADKHIINIFGAGLLAEDLEERWGPSNDALH